jgi:Flp pilus assembly protein TadB
MKSVFTALALGLAVAIATPALAQQTPAPAKKVEAKEKAKKEQPARANKGGETRGQDRADQVKQQNQQRKAN